MNSRDKSSDGDKPNLFSPSQSSTGLDSGTLVIENVLDHSQFVFHPIITDPLPRDLENIDIDGIEGDEEITNYECSEMSSAANSQSREGNVYEGQMLGDIDLTPTVALERRRKRGLDSLILSNFFTRTEKTPKKEYIRLRVIRGHKKAHRQIFKNQTPLINALHAFEPTQNSQYPLIWRILSETCMRYKSTISQSCKTESGPATDGKSRKKIISGDEAKSFNNNFCRNYFSIPGVLESYFWYIELIFANKNPSVLCRKFEMFCCYGPHSNECTNKWQYLHAYLNDIMIRDLTTRGLVMKAWFPDGYHQKNYTLEYLEQVENERLQHEQKSEDILRQSTL
ncbi:unnamed protein product [Blepharisma stoltei]|uniref:Uncharacterized protein n=1 Tax=Blepharisma stoltei TaxID=1481888 RepID=A0AAU9IZU1_9CILI|nr:unnamed protein product [Blepharisma stoltei]